MNLIAYSALPDFGQTVSTPAHNTAALAILGFLALAAVVAALAALKGAPAFNPIEMCGPKDSLD